MNIMGFVGTRSSGGSVDVVAGTGAETVMGVTSAELGAALAAAEREQERAREGAGEMADTNRLLGGVGPSVGPEAG